MVFSIWSFHSKKNGMQISNIQKVKECDFVVRFFWWWDQFENTFWYYPTVTDEKCETQYEKKCDTVSETICDGLTDDETDKYVLPPFR